MPLYEFECPIHGIFERTRLMTDVPVTKCIICGTESHRIISVPSKARVSRHEQLPYGNKSRGRFISHKETGGLDIMIPSWGALEKEEVDYLAEGAIEKEKERVKKRKDKPIRQAIDSYMKLAYQAKPGKRAKTIREAMS